MQINDSIALTLEKINFIKFTYLLIVYNFFLIFKFD